MFVPFILTCKMSPNLGGLLEKLNWTTNWTSGTTSPVPGGSESTWFNFFVLPKNTTVIEVDQS